jgi:hypothetical protein
MLLVPGRPRTWRWQPHVRIERRPGCESTPAITFVKPMNIQYRARMGLALLVWLIALLALRAQAGDGKEPVITGIRPSGTNLLVTVRLPDGCRRLTLESRPRMGTGAWIPRKDHWAAAGEEEVTLTLPMQSEVELLRAKGETEDELPLPARFFTGRREFSAAVSTTSVAPGTGGDFSTSLGGAAPGVPTTDARSEAGGTRAVVESDIWQIDGNTVYFFNSARGFQVIDLTVVDQPVLKGTLSFAAQGEQMYLLPGGTPEDRWLALLTASACDSLAGEVILVRVRNGVPELGPRLSFEGQVRESRLVGSALYLATYRWKQAEVSSTDPATLFVWRAETGIFSFDLSNPAAPAVRGEKVILANPDAIQATDRFLFVATTGPAMGSDDPIQPIWLRPGVRGVTIFDISDSTGAVEPLGSVVVKGRVADKFKLNLRDDVLTVVSSRDPEWRLVTRTNWYTREFGPNGERLVPPVREQNVYNTFEQTAPMSTWLETFSLATPTVPTKLGELKIIENESLFGTRFVGDRAYVVTFRQIDPLWIIDLSDPQTPRIRGELQIPGYSSYLEPVGTNRLLAVGVDGGNATVALFDVSDEERPTQLSKVFLGTGWSWSEANSDEKAFKFLPELGLVLVPWQGYENGQYMQSMQLIDYTGNQLVKRGLIAHRLNARRATSLSSRILSLSGQELLVVDATDRDNPVVKADLDLSFVVSQVRVSGDRLVLLSTTGGTIPTVRRVAAASPDVVLGSLALPQYPVVGFDMAGTNLHLLQLEPDTYRQEPVLGTNQVVTWIDQPPIRKEIVVTNIGWEVPEPIVTNRIITNIVVFPLLPTDPPGTQPRIETNIHIVPVIIRPPPVLVTNIQLVVRLEPVSPLPSTNTVVVTNWTSVTIPGSLVAREIGFDGDQPRLLGESRITRPASVGGAFFRALEATPNLLLWVEPSSTGPGWGWPTDILLPGVMPGIAIGDAILPGGRGWWWWWWQNSLVIVAEDISAIGNPVLQSAVTLGGTEKHQGFSDAFVSEGRLYVSHREAITREETKGSDATGGIITPGLPTPWWVTETRHVLNVVDFADPAEPMFRTQIGLPAELVGISHRGGLLYTAGSTTNTPAGRHELSALAYDGLGAALVDVTAVSAHSGVQAKADGRVYAVEPVQANAASARVESMWISSEGRWTRGTSVNVPGASPVLRGVGSLLITDSTEGLGFVRPTEDGAALLGVMTGTCGFWIDWTAGDSGADAAVWAPGLGARLLELRPEVGLTGP